jgi:hypothetical protein|tara:strand:- start:283 stop:540 length:258 start_codon:yes stop_codon:yes gene_type:complete
MSFWEFKKISDIADLYEMGEDVSAKRWRALHRAIRLLMKVMPPMDECKTDNELIVIEHHLLLEYGIEWDGKKFHKGEVGNIDNLR